MQAAAQFDAPSIKPENADFAWAVRPVLEVGDKELKGDPQGVTHDDFQWYFVGEDFVCAWDKDNEPMGEEMTCEATRPFTEYTHHGAPCFSKRHDLIYVPMHGGPGDRHFALGVMTPFGPGRPNESLTREPLRRVIPLGPQSGRDLTSWCAIDDETGFLYLSEFEIVQELHQYLITDDGLDLLYLGTHPIGRQVFTGDKEGAAVFRSAKAEGEHWTWCPCDGPKPDVCRREYTGQLVEACDLDNPIQDRYNSSTLYVAQGGVITPSHTLYLTTSDQKMGTVKYPGLLTPPEERAHWFYKGVLFAVDLRTGVLRSHKGTAIPVDGLQGEVWGTGTDTQTPEIEGLTYWPSAPGFPGQLHIIVALNELDIRIHSPERIGYDNYAMVHLTAKNAAIL